MHVTTTVSRNGSRDWYLWLRSHHHLGRVRWRGRMRTISQVFPPEPQLQPKKSKTSSPGPSFWDWAPTTEEIEAAALLENTTSSQSLPKLQSAIETERELAELTHSFPQLWQSDVVSEPTTSEQTLVSEDRQNKDVDEPDKDPAKRSIESKELKGKSEIETDQGVSIRPDGVHVFWTIRRGIAEGGTVVWQDKSWEAMDKWGRYLEMGAEKSGRNLDTEEKWEENWTESLVQSDTVGQSKIQRRASKWAHSIDGVWDENWSESYFDDGRAYKDAKKHSKMDYIPEEGHAAEWTEEWGEIYGDEGPGVAKKWTNRYAEDSTRNRKWGEKWEERFHTGGCVGYKSGETWNEHNSHFSSSTWGEEYTEDSKLHKYGKSADGYQWDVWEDQEFVPHASVYPHFDWHLAHRHSPELLSLKKKARKLRRRG